jgi:glycosyltransferase involved in cell wall biosynthesis
MISPRLAPLRPVRVLFLNDTARNGGPGRSLHTILRHLDPSDVYRAVVLPRPGPVSDLLADVCETLVYLPDFVENPVEPLGRPMRRDDLDAWAALRATRALGNVYKMGRSLTALSRLVTRGAFDLIYCNGTTADFAGATVGLLTSTPALWHVRYTHVPDATRALHAHLAESHTVRRIVCVSRAAAKLFAHCPGKVSVVHNAVDTSELSPAVVRRGIARAELGLDEDAFVFGAHGRVLPRKGFVEMLRAAHVALGAMNEHERSRAHFVIVGDTPEDIGRDHVEECRHLARELGIERRVHFTGFRSDVRPYVRDFDIEIVSSVYEDPLPRAVIEAMALGVPVIGADVGGIGEMLVGGGGVLVPPGDVAALAQAMLSYMRDDASRKRDGVRGRERAVAEYDAREHAARIKTEISLAVFGEGVAA